MKKGLLVVGVLGLLVYFAAYDQETNKLDWSWVTTAKTLIVMLQDQELEKYVPAGGEPLEEINGMLVTGLEEKNIKWIPLERIPQHLRLAIIAVEDNRFYQHGPIDMRGIARAAWVNLNSGEFTEGGSTITQQLVKNIYLTNDKTFQRKGEELVLAYLLEKKYSKENILEMYLNQIYFGPGTYGVEKASERYFQKSVDKLNLAEAAMLAGIPKNPAKYSPRNHFQAAKQRQAVVLDRMMDLGFITKAAAQQAKQSKVAVDN